MFVMDRKMRFGLKIAASDWYWKYNLSYDEAVEKMKAMGVDFITTYNEYLLGADTAVPGEVPKDAREKMAHYSEKAFREKLRGAGIAYMGWLNFNFYEEGLTKFNNYAIDQDGNRIEKIDWYIGACPTCDAYTEDRLAAAEAAIKHLDMDGLFLGFMRFPGFWELWLPGTNAEIWREYCFCDRCLERFQKESGIVLPGGTRTEKADWLRGPGKEAWTKFKCGVIHDIVGRFRNMVKKYNPDAYIMLNMVPFDKSHYGEYGKQLFGQDTAMLSDVVDIFEVMGYHQILAQPPGWIRDIGNYFKEQSGKTVLCTLQGQALYTQGMHAGKKRLETIGSREFKDALAALHDSRADGVVIFTWSDLLRREYEDHDSGFTDLLTGYFGRRVE
jgi:hypothetical protein